MHMTPLPHAAYSRRVYYELTDHFIVQASIDDTWRFFSDAANLPRITPPWLAFTVTTPSPVRIEQDALLDYTIRWKKLPMKWRTRIIDWSPPRQFIDLQLRGPYALWHHQHTFTPGDEGVICSDRVIYKLPAGPIGRLTHAALVRRQLLDIFRFRRQIIGQSLGWVRAVQEDIEIRAIG
jgi:ligand-binding SRPBCC domain-containing protein